LSLRQALDLQGGKDECGKAETLLRAAAGAYLNIVSACVQYPLTAPQLAAEVNAALASCDAATIIAEAARLDAFNNLGCPLDQQGNCSNASFTPKDIWRNAVREYVAMALRPARLVYWY